MPTVNHTVYDPNGAPVEGARVTVRLVGSTSERAPGGFITANDREIIGEVSDITDDTGAVSFTLTANADITPAGTYYEVVEKPPGWPARTLQITVTAGGPHNLADLLTTPPAAIVPAGAASLTATNRFTGLNHFDVVTVAERPWIDVQHPDYGAVGDGITNDTAAIQAALDAAGSGATVFFPNPSATYLVTGNLRVPGGVTLLGRATPQQGPTIKLANSANPNGVLISKTWDDNATTSGEPIIIENLRTDGNKANNSSGDGIIIMNYRSRVQGVTVKDCAGNGVRFTAKNKAGTVISNTEVENRLIGCFITGCGARGFWTEEGGGKVTDGFCIDNIIATCAGDGMDIERSSGWVIRGNHLYTNEDNGIVARFGFFTTIEGNYVEGYGINNDGATYRGIYCPSALTASTHIRSNRVRNSNTGGTNIYRAIEAGGGSGVDATFHIVDNHVDGNGSERGLWSFSSGGGGSVRGTIIGNYFVDVAAQVLDIPDNHFFRIEGNSFNYATAAPSSGKWPRGMHVWNSEPAAGGDPGWVCVTGGSPGTWKAMANIDA